MVNNLLPNSINPAARTDGETVEALFDMLCRNGLEPSKISALISKASYPPATATVTPSNSNRSGKGRTAQSA